jgi:uncharacterized protein
VDGPQTQVETSLSTIDPAEWTRLENGRSFYQSYPWLSWVEESSAADAFYVLARDPGGTLVGALPAYVIAAANTSWSSWYDPLNVFAGHDATATERRSAWFPLLLLGSMAGYHSDFLVDRSLDEDEQRAVIRALALRCTALAGARHTRSMAMMYAPEGTATAVAGAGLGAREPILTSANTRINASWSNLDAFLNSFPRRRRYNIQREIDLFRSSGSRIVESRLSDCLHEVGPLLGNVHRKHGASDTDADTTHYLATQIDHLDDVSRVFLEVADGRPAGFSLCYEWGRELHVRVVGFDYERSARFSYFNLAYYLPLNYAIQRGLENIYLGTGTYEAKAARGAVLDPTWSLVWPPDDDNASWFEAVKRPGEDAQEADPWMPVGR